MENLYTAQSPAEFVMRHSCRLVCTNIWDLTYYPATCAAKHLEIKFIVPGVICCKGRLPGLFPLDTSMKTMLHVIVASAAGRNRQSPSEISTPSIYSIFLRNTVQTFDAFLLMRNPVIKDMCPTPVNQTVGTDHDNRSLENQATCTSSHIFNFASLNIPGLRNITVGSHKPMTPFLSPIIP